MGPWHLLDGPAWERLTWTLLHFLWQGLLIVAGGEILLALLRLKQAQPRYAILVAGLALMAFCPLATFLLLDIPGAGAVADPGPQALAPATEDRNSESAASPAEEDLPTPVPSLDGPLPAATSADPVQVPSGVFSLSEKADAWRQDVTRLSPYCLLLWLAGVLLLTLG